MKLFYDCPIESAYMAKNFGVEFLSEGLYDDKTYDALATSGYPSSFSGKYIFQYSSECKIYVHPDSYHIFEPQDGDKNIDGFIFDGKLKGWLKEVYVEGHGEAYENRLPEELPITERNGKVFIQPQQEK